jgi:hypothetical protein
VLVGGHGSESEAAGEHQASQLPAQFVFPTSSPSRMPSLDLDIIIIVTEEFFLFPTDTRLWSFQSETHHRCRHHTDDVCGVRSGGRVSSASLSDFSD